MGDKAEPVAGPRVLLPLDRAARRPLHEQLEHALREQIRTGRLAAGSRLPSSRALAAELEISRGVVLEAYAQLTAEGYLTASQGAPTRVAATGTVEAPPLPASSLEHPLAYQFDPSLPDLAAFPREQWLRSVRAAVAATRFDTLGPGDPRGTRELRNQLLEYLGRARGAAPEPEHTVICAGFTQGYALLCRTLQARGVERIAIEDPGSAGHRLQAQAAGLEPVPIRVDGGGIDVGALACTDCEVVVLTPAHQYPTGAVLSAGRRAALLEWAEDRDSLIIEDDYDSELRYDREAVGALQGLAPERVCLIGSVSTRLAPALRLGWLLSPSWLSGALTYEKGLADGGTPTLDQLALADLIARGELDRHLRRMRRSYRSRREALLAALARELPGARAVGVPAGLHMLVLLPAPVDEDAVVSGAAALGVGVDGLSSHRLARGDRPGLVIGFGSLPEPAIARGIRLLAQAVDQAVPV